MTNEALNFFDVDEGLAELSAKGDDLERLNGLVDFELFRPALEAAVPRGDRSKSGRPPFRSCAHVRGPDPASHAWALRRALRISDQGPAVFHAVPRARPRRWGSRRQHDLGVSRGVEKGRGRRRLVRSFRRRATRVRLSGDERADRRYDDRRRAQAAQHARGKDGHQGRSHSRRLERQAGQDRAEGPGRALDGEIQQGEAARGRIASPG